MQVLNIKFGKHFFLKLTVYIFPSTIVMLIKSIILRKWCPMKQTKGDNGEKMHMST